MSTILLFKHRKRKWNYTYNNQTVPRIFNKKTFAINTLTASECALQSINCIFLFEKPIFSKLFYNP